MTNSIKKGKRVERWFANELQDIFPNICRNLREQSKDGGVDLVNCIPFDFEVKSGKQATLKTIKNWLDQLEEEGTKENYNVVLAKPDKRRGAGDDKFDPYIIMPFGDFLEVLGVLKKEGIL